MLFSNWSLRQRLEQWERLTIQANHCFYDQEYSRAYKLYARSADVIEPLLSPRQELRHDVVRRFVLSCHNTAYCCIKQGHLNEAEYFYHFAYNRLMSLQKRSKCQSPELLMHEVSKAANKLSSYVSQQRLHFA